MATDDWKHCAAWLVQCQIIPPDHAVTKPSAEVYDLAQLLRDGVLLCHLLNKLQPGIVDPKHFSQRPQLCQFLCLKNIRVFLQNCRTVFGLKDTDLFDPNDLFEIKDFGKVVATLSKLSRSPEAQRNGVRGFSVTSNKKDYMNLEEFADHDIDDYDQTYDSVDLHEDEIYEDLVSVRRRKPTLQSTHSIAKTRREYCIAELVETERYYVDVLTMIIQHFIRPLQSALTPADHAVIFAHIEDLHQIHTGFHSDLSQACALSGRHTSPDQLAIPDCFIKWKEKFLIYGDYCTNLPKCLTLLDEVCKKDSVVAEKLMDCQIKANDGKFRLRDLFTVPFQRVLKYHLLLKELIKNTDKDHREYNTLHKALEEMQDLSLYVNEVKRDNETLGIIEEIEKNITDLEMPENTSLRDYGRLLKDGDLKIKKHPSNTIKARFVFLFDKVMLMCKSRTVDKILWGGVYNYKDAVVLANFRLENLPKSDRNGFGFMLVEKSNDLVFTIFAKTEELKAKWLDAIRLAHENTCPPGAKENKHDFTMHTFPKPTICDVCRKLLRGVFFQGYLCSNTGMAVHKECITKAKDLDGPPRPPPRFRAVIGRARAKLAHHPQNSTNGRILLNFNEGDLIDVLDKSDRFWWEGRLGNQEGMFPPDHVTVLRVSQVVVTSASDLARSASFLPQTPRISTADSRSSISSTTSHELSVFPWYVDDVSRDHATVMLENCSNGTFLVRRSTNPSNRGNYALSIKFGGGAGAVKHIRIEQTPEGNFYLADCKMFQSIPELVNYYKDNTLKGSFPELDTTLLAAYKDAMNQPSSGQVLGFARAMYDYSANQPNQISITAGDKITIVSKQGEGRGWWKGTINGKTGYFPCAYVEEED